MYEKILRSMAMKSNKIKFYFIEITFEHVFILIMQKNKYKSLRINKKLANL